MRYFLLLVACVLAWNLVRANDERPETAEKDSNRLKRWAGSTAGYPTKSYPYSPSTSKQTGYTKVAYSTTPYPRKSSTTKKKSWFGRKKRQAWTTAGYPTKSYPYNPSTSKQTGYTKVAYSTTPYPRKSSTTKKKSWFGRKKRQAWYTTAGYPTTSYPYNPSTSKQTGYTSTAYSPPPTPYTSYATKQSQTDYTNAYHYTTAKYPDYQTTDYNVYTNGGSSGPEGMVYQQLINQGLTLMQEAQDALTDADAAANYAKQLKETMQ